MNLIRDDIDWAQYEEETEHLAKVKPAAAFLQSMIDNIGRPAAKPRQSYLPWPKTHKHFAFRDHETTLWAGVSGHGKSELLGQVTTSLLVQEEPAAVASFEMRPTQTLERQLLQFMGVTGDGLSDALRRDYYEQFQALTDKRMWLYDVQGRVATKRAVAFTRYCFKALGVKHVVLDSMMKVIRDEDDYNAQKNLLDELTSIARDYAGHVHLVHHLKKLESETAKPDRNAIKGSGAIVDQVDNVMLVWRNKQKELDQKAGKPVLDNDPDNLLIICKQRNGTGWEGPIKLFHNNETKQYTGAPGMDINLAAWPHVETRKAQA